MSRIWKPSVTVAAIIARDERFLMIEEETEDGVRINQPAGHLDPDETLQQAVIRETLEETAHDFTPTGLIGTYLSRYVSPKTGEQVTYLRFAFAGELGAAHQRALDHGILRTVWMSQAELLASQARHRSPLVMQCVNDYLAGQRAPLSLLYTHPSALSATRHDHE
ncbi:NUDIX hydrolase [Undibacterium sp. Jales W-56]|uniref:NUDIX hydrolase n=1 Tax=Undibacterium sp. Jales W-56 TaxID=2897325 RepID=UPI0021D36C30|nr:NUDIX hydrolase [Undibacterium sp. Jales W-56]MCU6432463.1 NUDIX hydrolase [Undibacterium sp. Jales W-56]